MSAENNQSVTSEPGSDQDHQQSSSSSSNRRRSKRNKKRSANSENSQSISENEISEIKSAENRNSSELELQLKEKEELVAILIERLEQAAEKLDRNHRTGADRGKRITSSGMPAELIESQKTVTEELQQAVERWEDMQVGSALGRIEIQVSEIRDLITNRMPDGGSFQAAAAVGGINPGEPSEIVASANEPEPGGAGWAAMKARMMDPDGEPTATPQQSLDQSIGAALGDIAQESNAQPEEAVASAAPAQLDKLPEPVDIDAASAEELQEAVKIRDDYITFLVHKLRFQNNHSLPENWEELSNVPEELKSRLESLAQELKENLRESQVGLSLERAKLARQESQLNQLSEVLEKKMKRLGLSEDEEPRAASEEAPAQEINDGSSRWMKFLGKGKSE